MTDQSCDFMSLEELKTRTGLSKRELNNDIKAGYLPGRVTDKGIPRVLRNDYERFLAGEWRPRTPINLTSINSKRKETLKETG